MVKNELIQKMMKQLVNLFEPIAALKQPFRCLEQCVTIGEDTSGRTLECD